MSYSDVCPECGGDIQSVYYENNNSYYLECKVGGYGCWHKNCTKEIASKFPQKNIARAISASEQRLLDAMSDALDDDDVDYYHHWE